MGRVSRPISAQRAKCKIPIAKPSDLHDSNRVRLRQWMPAIWRPLPTSQLKHLLNGGTSPAFIELCLEQNVRAVASSLAIISMLTPVLIAMRC
jgi:hypothetical protein